MIIGVVHTVIANDLPQILFIFGLFPFLLPRQDLKHGRLLIPTFIGQPMS